MKVYRYFELHDDLGHDFYRVFEDEDTGSVSIEVWDGAWRRSWFATVGELFDVGAMPQVTQFTEVTKDDVR